MTHPQAAALERQIAEDERRIARIGEPRSPQQVMLLFSLERELKEMRRRLSLLRQESFA